MLQQKKVRIEEIQAIFGKEGAKDTPRDTLPGRAFFSNATLPEEQQTEIKDKELAAYLYRNIASTSINEKGVARPHSLRVTEVCFPIALEGCITDLEAEDEAIFKKAFKWLRHLGVNRNRGLGRCKFSCIKKSLT